MFAQREHGIERSPRAKGAGRLAIPARIVLVGLIGAIVLGSLPGCAGVGGCGPCSRWSARRPLLGGGGAYEPGISAGVLAPEPPATVVVPGETLTPAPTRIIPAPMDAPASGGGERIINEQDVPAGSPPSAKGTVPLDSTPKLPEAPKEVDPDLSPLPEKKTMLEGTEGTSPAAYTASIATEVKPAISPPPHGGDPGPGSPPNPLPGELISPSAPPLSAPVITLEPPLPESPNDATSGFSPFSAVDSDLAGGAVPAPEGLDWLSSLGYRTLVDLRDPGDGRAEFIREAQRRGLRYVSCAAPVESSPKVALASFEAEINQAAARPIYFFDEEGIRAGELWYLHRKLTHKIADDLAREEAMTLGYDKGEDRLRRLVEAVTQPKTPPEAVEAKPAPATKPARFLPNEEAQAVPDAFGDAPVPRHVGLPPISTTIALMATLSLPPLGYLGRTAFDNVRARVWASLRGLVTR